MKYAIMAEMLPDRDGIRKLRMGGPVFDTREEAEEDCAQIRRQNLPYRGWVVEFEDPRS